MPRTLLRYLLLFLLLSWVAGCVKEVALPVTAGFDYQSPANSFTVPATVTFTNTSTGGETFQWTFEGGEPGSSSKKTPGEIVYKLPGTYNVRLEVSNFDGNRSVVEKKIIIDANLKADFSYALEGNSYAPATVKFTNLSAGFEKTEWSFEGGTPATSTQKDPTVTFDNGGVHKVRLKVSNSRLSTVKDTAILLEPELTPHFTIEIPKQFEELEAPVTLQLKNSSVGNTTNLWLMEGADSNQSAEKDPTARFAKAGTYTVSLEVGNGKKTKKISQTVTVKPSKGYAYIQNAELGIYNGRGERGIFYSTALRKAFQESEDISPAEAATIDLLFFGLNEEFTFNRFLSPDAAAAAGINPIAGVGKTVVLNPLSVENAPVFDNLGEAQLKALSITRSEEDPDDFFSENSPKIVLFENAQKKKGVLLIKEFIKDGPNSRIRFDIKVLK